MTDELEARWQTLLERVPRLRYHHVQVEWDQEFAVEHVAAIASLLGERAQVNPDRLTNVAKHHVHTGPSYPGLIAEAKSYERLVNYPSYQMKLLAHRERNFEKFHEHSSD